MDKRLLAAVKKLKQNPDASPSFRGAPMRYMILDHGNLDVKGNWKNAAVLCYGDPEFIFLPQSTCMDKAAMFVDRDMVMRILDAMKRPFTKSDISLYGKPCPFFKPYVRCCR